jgi:uncharacterized protein (TIGR00255 family)
MWFESGRVLLWPASRYHCATVSQPETDMIKSMTSFASAEQLFDFGRLAWELRTVNHRYLEFSLRLPEEFRVLEPEVRKRIGRHVSRGKVDATLRYSETPGSTRGRLVLNTETATSLLQIHDEFAALSKNPEKPGLTSMLRWPGMVVEELPDPGPMRSAAMELLEKAAADLHDGRLREGDQMAQAISERLDGVAVWTGKIRGWLPEIRAALRERMLERIGDLDQNLEPGRLETEVAVLAQKMDVDEELDRLDSHVTEARRTLELTEPVGRRLDFLMQEFNRESNTLSSKSVDQRTTQAAVELKVLIEQMREQVQNVE